MRSHFFLSSINHALGGGADFTKILSAKRQGFTGTISVPVAASSTETSFGFTEPPGARGSVGVADFVVKVSVTTPAGTANQLLLRTRIRRVSATGTVLASSNESASQSMHTAGVKTFNFVAVDLGAFEPTDLIRVDYIFQNTTGGILTPVIANGDTLDTEFVAPWSQGLLSVAARNALDKTNIKAAWIVEMDLPGGTVKGSLGGADILEAGSYPDKIQSMSPIPFGVPLRTEGAEFPEVTLDWEDSDFAISKIVEGPDGDQVVGSAVRIKLAIAGVVESDWPVRFVGEIKGKRYRDLTWQLRFGIRDQLLTRGPVPRLRVLESDFPNAAAESYQRFVPQVFGIWDSVGVTGAGALPTIPVGFIPLLGKYCYLVAHAHIEEITRAYSDGTTLEVAAWSELKTTINGHNYTLVGFTTDQLEATITVDAKGISIGGNVIERPMTIFQLWLLNWVEGDYLGGTFGTSIPKMLDPANVSSMILDYEEVFDLKAALYISEQVAPIQIIDDLLHTWNYRAYWRAGTNALFDPQEYTGSLIVKPMDHRPIVTYFNWPWAQNEDISDLEADYDDRELIDRVDVLYLQDKAEGGFARNLQTRDPRRSTNITNTVEMSWGAARIL